MREGDQPSSGCCFDAFEVDPRARQLRKHGTKIKLHGQPFQILLMLLERPGEVVTREEMRQKLWSADTFVDFEHSLNTAIKKLRQALGDSAEKPRYIETLPRLGYRFAAPVQARPQEPAERTIPLTTLGGASASLLSKFDHWRWKWILAVTAAAGLAVAVGLLVVPLHTSRALSKTDLVLVSDFVNTTGEPVFDGSLKRALTVKLAESPYFNLVDDAKVQETLGLMDRSSDERVLPSIAREVCQRGGAKVVVGGSILALGGHYVVDLDAKNCLTGSSLIHEETEARSKEQVLSSLERVIPRLRRKLGESLSSIQKFDTPIEQATTSSLAALKAYTSGDEKRAQGQEAESIPFYKLAIDLDPNFAIAYARLAGIYRNFGEYELSDEYLKKAFERREHLSEREKFYIAAHYYADSSKETDKVIEIYKLWTQTYPHDWIPFNNLSNEYSQIGQPEKAIEAGREALRLNPDHGLPYAVLAYAYQRTSRFAETKTICEKAIAAKRDGFFIHAILYWNAFVEGDEAAMQQQINWFKGKPLETWILNYQAWATASSGQLRKASEFFQRSRVAALRQGIKEYAVETTSDEAQADAEFGLAREARAAVDLSLRLKPDSMDAQAGGAVALARVGDLRRAEELTKEVSKRFPLGTLLNNVTLPCARAAIEMGRRNPAAAIEELGRAVPYDLSNPADAPDGCSIYYRGLAYLDLRSGEEAAAEFQKILANRGVFPISPYWPLAHLGLARAYALTGDSDKSLAQYREFLALWKNADPDLPVLKEAKAEYGKLNARAP